MKLSRFLPLLVALGFAAPVAVFAAEATDGETAARITALDIAGAFSNDGYKIRDGHWAGTLKPKEKFVSMLVNLYAGNQYYFSLGTEKPAKVALAVFDETGKKASGDPFREGEKTAAGVAPTVSGPYYVTLRLLEGEATSFCLLYSYK